MAIAREKKAPPEVGGAREYRVAGGGQERSGSLATLGASSAALARP